jgi:hypothetical protein
MITLVIVIVVIITALVSMVIVAPRATTRGDMVAAIVVNEASIIPAPTVIGNLPK